MTSTTIENAIDTAAVQARQVRFSRVLVTLIAGIFYAIGWLPGKLWLAVVFAALVTRQGWREATHWQPPVQAPAAEPVSSR